MSPGQPQSRLYEALHAVADGLEPEYRDKFLAALEEVRDSLDEGALLSAVRRQNADDVVGALGFQVMRRTLREKLKPTHLATTIGGGQATAEVAAQAGLFEITFRQTNPNAVLAAERDVGTFITRIDDETRRAVRRVAGEMFTEGLPPAKAAPRLRAILGLTDPQASYVLNFAGQLEAIRTADPRDVERLAREATDRRLDAVTKARIRKAARDGALTDDLTQEFTETYASSLRNRRALNVARTESARAAHAGQQTTWRQAVQDGHLSAERTRRIAVVTPDDRLRETHAAVPGMNEAGVGIEEPFQTPFGPMMYPPWETSCRCSVGLIFVDSDAIL